LSTFVTIEAAKYRTFSSLAGAIEGDSQRR